MSRQTKKPLIRVVLQRHKGDCAIACLASLLHPITYEEILVVAAHLVPTVLVDGLTNDEMMAVARKFGQTLTEHSYDEIDFRKMRGVLGGHLKGTEPSDQHAVVLSNGLVFEPDSEIFGEIWRVRDYIERFQMTGIDFLELEE